MVDEKSIRKALKTVKHPKLQKSFVELGLIRNITIKEGKVGLTIALKSDRSPEKERLIREIKNVLKHVAGVSEVKVEVAVLSRAEVDKLFPKAPLKGIENVRHVVAVASGKGGVGKTTVAVNLALALHAVGFQVGLMDADVYGPSISVMLALTEEPESKNDIFITLEKYGLRVMSLGMSVKQDQPFIWRGPLVAKMIHNLLNLVQWGELDYLVIDLPPGTGDPSITLAQAIPHCAILMITTPQEVALADVRRAIGLFQKTGQSIVGLVENMSYFLCGHSEQPIEIFGHGGGEKLSRETGIPLLGAIPLDLELRQGGDVGVPLMVSAPDSVSGRIFQKIAKKLIELIDKS